MRVFRFSAAILALCSIALASTLAAGCGDDPIVDPGAADGAAHIDASQLPDAARDAAFDAESSVIEDAGAPDRIDAGGDAAPPHDGAPDADAADAPQRPPGPPVCGDGWRDEATEECDDGDAGETCSGACVVEDVPIAISVADSGTVSRTLASGAHPVGASDLGFAIAVTSVVSSASSGSGTTSLALQAFTADGVRRVPVAFGQGSTAIDTSDPVVAALPNGRYVVAWTDSDGDGDGQGVALRAIDPVGGTVGPLGHVNTTTLAAQNAPDIVWTGNGIAVAWADDSDLASGTDLKIRTFDASLVATSPEIPLASTADLEAEVALCAFEGGWAAAWRSFANGDETIHGRTAAGANWAIGPFSPGPTSSPPSLVELDATHLLVAYTESIVSPDAGATTQVRLAVLDVASGGGVPAPIDLLPTITTAQSSPRLAKVGGSVFVTWWQSTAGTADGEDVSIAEVVWTAGAPLDVRPAISLPRAHRHGDQRAPALAAMHQSLVSAWDDLGQSIDPSQSNHDVVLEVIPIPIVRHDVDGGP